MNEEAFNTMYMLAQKEGYKKTPEEFKTLLSSNQEAFNTMYSIAQREGYKKTPEEFKTLLGVSGVEGEPVNFTEGSGEQQEQPAEPLEKPIVGEVNFSPYAVTTASLAGRNIEKPKTTYDDSFRGKFKQLLDEEVEKIDDNKIVSQEEQSDILSKLTKRAEQIEVERAGIEVSEDALFEKTSAQKALDELLVKEFPIDVISEGGRNVSPTIENLEKLKKLDPAFSDYVYNKALKQKNFFDKLEKGQVTERDKYKIMADFNSLKLQDSYDNLQITINENNKIVEDIDKSIEQQKNEMLSTPYFVLDEDGKFSAGIIKTPEQRAEAQSMYNKLSSLIDDKNAQSTSPQYSKNYIDFLNASAKQDALESGEYKDIHKKLKENEIYKEELLDGSWASFGKDLTARLVNGASSFVANSVAFPASLASSYRSLIGADYKYGISDMVVDWAESTSEPFNASERKFTMKDPFTDETKYDAGGLVLSGVDQLGLLFGLAFGNKYSSIKAANKLSKAGITGKRASDAMKISQRWNTFLTGTMASHAQNLRESREMGLSGADLFAYTTFMSTLEGTSELVFPNQNILGKDLKDIALKTFVKNLGKGRKLALKTSLNEVLTAMGSEAAEEYIVLLGKMTQTALISINNEEINTYIPEFEEVIETGAVASLVGGGSTSVIQGYQNITGAKRKEIMSYAISKGTEVDFNGLKTAVAQQVEKENISQYDAESYLRNVHLANNYTKYIPDEIKGKTRQELLPIAQQLDSLIKQSKEKEGVAKKALQKKIKVLEDYMESKINGESITQTPSYDKPTVFTTPTSERYGTVNRQDGKGEVVLTEEEYNNEISLFEQQEIKEITPTEEVSETVREDVAVEDKQEAEEKERGFFGKLIDKGFKKEKIEEDVQLAEEQKEQSIQSLYNEQAEYYERSIKEYQKKGNVVLENLYKENLEKLKSQSPKQFLEQELEISKTMPEYYSKKGASALRGKEYVQESVDKIYQIEKLLGVTATEQEVKERQDIIDSTPKRAELEAQQQTLKPDQDAIQEPSTEAVEEDVTAEFTPTEEVKEEVTEKVEPTKPITEETLTEEETSALDDILGFSGQKKRVYTDNKSESDKRRLKRVNNALDKIEDSFQKIFPNLYIGIAEDSDMFAKFAKEQGTSKESRSRGVFTSINVEGEPKRYGIILNPDFANVTTAFHEAFHALMKVNGFNNEQARAVTSRMIKSVQKGATPELNENLERFVSQYETPEQSEEYMSELFGILSYNYSKQSGTVKGTIKRWLRKLAEILGLKPKNTLLSSVGLSDSDAATVNMLNVLADKMSRGKVLSKEDVTALRMGGPLTAQQVAADMRMDEEQGGIKKQMPQSASKVLYNDSDVLPKPSKKKSNSQVAQDLAEVAAEYYGGNIITSNTITAKQEEEIIQVGTEEAIKAFEDSGKSAADWYSTAIEKAMAVAAVIHPSLSSKEEANKYDIFKKEKDPVKAANLAMRIALAITSQNLNVEANAKYANEQFDILKKTGKFDASREYGTKATSISSNLRLANELINKIGLNQSENFITKEFNTARLEEAASEVLGKKVKISGLRNDLVNGAALFGPKIGQGFLQNLMGKFEPVTIDLWLRRTWGRWTGDVVGVGVTEERMARLLNGISEAKKDTGFDIPDFMRKHKVIKKIRPSSGSSYSTMSDSFTNELEDNDGFRNDISIFAKELTAKANTMYKLIKNEPMSKELYRDFMSGKKTYGQTANELQIIKDKTSDKYKDYASKEKAKGLTPIKKSEWVKTQNKKEGRDIFPNNKAISSRKPEWVKASTTIINDLKPIDIPSNQDRKVITRVVKEIRNRMEKQGYSVTNADVQALLWYPEKDIWSKLRGEEESNLKQSYDEQFIKIAEKQGIGKEARAAAEGIKSRRATQLGGTDGRTTDVKVSRPIAKKETESIKKSKRQPREQYPLEDIGRWWGDADYKSRGGELVYMTPDEFLSKAKPLKMDEDTKENIDDLVSHIEEGRKLDPLTLYSTDKTDVRSSDGRHRAYAAKELNINSVPVVDFTSPQTRKKSKRQPEKNKKLKEAIEFAKDNNLSPKKLNNYLLSKGYTQEEIDEATPVKSKPKESIKKLINKVSRITDNNEARAIVAKELRELLKDSKLSQFSKRTINKVITSLKNTNVSNMQKMLDKVDDAISNDEGRAERIKRYKNRSIAIKRIAKIGPLKELQDPFIRMMGIDPKYLSKETQKEYDSVLSDILNINKKYDKTSRDAFKAKIDLVLDSYELDSLRAKEIADRINELIDPNKTLNTNLARLEKNKKITKEERELITRFKSLLDESSVADPMAGYTEEEIEEYKGMLEAEKREGIEEDFIETLSQPQSAFYSADDTGAFKLSEEERRYVKEANSITLKDIQELSLRDAKSVVRALEAMKAGFLTPELFQGVIKVRGVRGNMSIPLNEIKQTGVVDKISSKISSSILNIGRKKKITGIGDRIRSAPTKNYEQVLKVEKELLSDGSKRFKGTNIYKSLFRPTSMEFSKSEQTLNRIEDKLKNATALLSRNQNERFIQKAKIMVFQIQREYDSNVGNKEVNQAKDWINATIKDKDTALDERDIRELEKIRDRYLTDGQVDAKKLYDSLTANEKKALEIIDGVYDELTFMARMDAAVQGMPFIHRENYIHLPKSGTKTSEISNDFEPLFDSFMNASVKNKAAIQRTGKTHSISFDPVSNAYSASRKIVVGYHMYPVIKSTRIAFSGLKNRAETRFEKDLVNELESIYDRIINSQYKNVTKNKAIADNIFRYLTKAGYFSQLSGVFKAAWEFGSNTLHAVMNHAGSLVDGYATLVSVDTKTIDKALENTDTTQMDRLTKTAKFDNKDIEGKLLSKAKLFNPEQMTGELAASAKTVGKVAAMPFQTVFKLNESLITKPDEMVIRPLFVGEFQNRFKQLTGQKLNWEKLANDELYRDRFQEAINQASEQADSAVIDTSASTNPFDTIPSNISDPDASNWEKAMQVINRYMTNFRVFEYYSAVKGVQNLLGKGEISRGAGMMLLASTIMRMSIYRLGIDYAFGLIFSMLGMDEDEDEIKEEDLTRSVLSGIVTLAFGRNLGNFTQTAVNLGIEFANMEFGEGITWDSVTKDGEKTEYDSYKDYMVFSKIPVKRSPGRDLFVDFLISSAGPLTPTIKSVRRATTLTDRSIYNKTKESRDKNKNELFFKTPFDIAGSLGFIPNYKELKKINDRYWFGGNRDTEKKTTEKKTKGKILGRTRTQSSRSFSTGRKAPRSNRTR